MIRAALIAALLFACPAAAQQIPTPPDLDQCRAEHEAATDEDARAAAAHACSGRVVEACTAGGADCLKTASGAWIRHAIDYVGRARMARKGEPPQLAMVQAAHGYPKLLEACPEGDFDRDHPDRAGPHGGSGYLVGKPGKLNQGDRNSCALPDAGK